MNTADIERAARDVVGPAGAMPVATVVQTPGAKLPTGHPAGTGSRTIYQAAWLLEGRRRSETFGPEFEKQSDLSKFLQLLTGAPPALSSPAEYAPRHRAVTEPGTGPECLCGCGERTKGGRFRPGHDARYHAAQKAAGKH